MARDFNGTTQDAINAGTPVTAVPITIACWFNSDSVTADQALVSIQDTAGGDRFLLLANGTGAGDPVMAQSRTSGVSRSALSTTGFTTGTWYHACGVFATSTSRTAYIDGGSAGSNALSSTPASIAEIALASINSASTWLNGRLAEVGVWNVALNASEVAALAGRVSPLRIRTGSLKIYVPMFGVGSPERDYIGGYHMTLNNTPAQSAHYGVQPPFGYDYGWRGAFTAAAAPSGWAHLLGDRRNRLVYA